MLTSVDILLTREEVALSTSIASYDDIVAGAVVGGRAQQLASLVMGNVNRTLASSTHLKGSTAV
jgi:hypothetical protein